MNELFIYKSKKIHGDKYDYSLVNYINNKTKVEIICSEHGIFKQRPNDHLTGYGCSFCSGKCKLNNNTFIEKSKVVHGDKYNYHLVNYINNKTKVKIICSTHGIFEQTPDKHINSKQGCSACSKTLTNLEFIKKIKLIYGEFYLPIDDYISYKHKINFKCYKHGIFRQSPENLFKGHACRECNLEKRCNTESFVDKSKEIHGDKYDYSLVNYINKTIKVKIICKIHGEFEQRPTDHLNGCGCPICRESKGEKKIRNFLNEKKIKFLPQYKFNNCKHILQLSFDFYLPEYNICIEYNGIQHYKPIEKFGGKNQFLVQNKCDNIKKEFCLKNNIKLIIIKYDNNILDVLTNKLKYEK